VFGGIGVPEFVIVLVVVAGFLAVCWPAARIAERLGFPRWLGLLAVVPGVNLLLLWFVALTRWPRVEPERPR
jgi:hypothetical protein